MKSTLDSLEEYGKSFIEKTIRVLLTNKEYLTKMESGIELEHFTSPDHQWLIKHIKVYFEKYKTVPSVDYLKIELKKFKKSSENNVPTASSVSTLLKNIYNEELLDSDLEYIETQYEEFCRKKAFENITEIVPELIKDGRYKDILELYKQADSIGQNKLKGHILKEEVEDLFREENHIQLPFQIQEFNNMFSNGAISGGSVVINLGAPGGGKSWFGVSWASHLLKLGFNVVYFNLESKYHFVAKRFHSCINEIPLDEITYDREILQQAMDSLEGNLAIVDLTGEQKTLGYMKSYLAQLEEARGWKPHLVIVDYVNKMKHKNKNEELVGQKDNWSEIIDWAKEEDFVIYSPSPVNRAGANDKVLTEDKIGGAYQAVYDCDFIMSYSKFQIAHIIKNKNGKGGGSSHEIPYDSNMGKFTYVDEYFEESKPKPTVNIADISSRIRARK